ncbi:RING-H2 finger protein ATL54, partial [Bienertia sinuspersici]
EKSDISFTLLSTASFTSTTTFFAKSCSSIPNRLIAIICIRGISFLLLTTCTIILRYRFTGRSDGVTPRIQTILGSMMMIIPLWITYFGILLLLGFSNRLKRGDDLRLLPKCCQVFHVSCIGTWLRSHTNCPLRRAPIVNEVLGGNSVVGNLNSRRFPMLKGAKVAEILKRNHELMIFSEL